MSRVFDCFMYNGEADVLTVRLNELNSIANVFVLVEADTTFSGLPREIAYRSSDNRFEHFKDRIRHVVVRDMPETKDPWIREAWQRNAVLRGLEDVAEDDIIILSDADEIPNAEVLQTIVSSKSTERVFGLRMQMSYFYLNYCIIDGPDFRTPWAAVVPAHILPERSPQEWRDFIRDESSSAQIVHNGGWHFSYLFDTNGVKRKINQFSHQEYNNEKFLEKIDIHNLVAGRHDLFGDRGHIWAVLSASTLPIWVQNNQKELDEFILSFDQQSVSFAESKLAEIAEGRETFRRELIERKKENLQKDIIIRELRLSIDKKQEDIDHHVQLLRNISEQMAFHEKTIDELCQTLEEKTTLAVRVGLEVRDMHQSLSWRLTAPLRSVQKRFGRS